MSILRDEFSHLIASLNAEKFRVLIQLYLKEKYKQNDVFITDGPYDGGNDLIIKINEKELKRNIQVTVQKDHIEKKIKEDLKKSKDNVHEFKYLAKLDFYYSQKLTRSFINELKLDAEVEFDIELTIIEANELAQEIENYPKVRGKLLDLLGIKEDIDFIKVDKQTKVVFDMLSNAQETGEMKKQFILSFIFTFLYENPNSTLDGLIKGVSEKLPEATDLKFYRDNLSSLKSKGLIVTDESRKLFSLSVEKTKEVDDIYAQALIQETQLKQAIEFVLSKYELIGITNELCEFIIKAYKANYMIDVEELSEQHGNDTSPLSKIMFELRTFLKNKGLLNESVNGLTKELFKACNENEYLTKVGASILFANLYESNKLEDYLTNRSQHYYLDTQVLLRLICYQYKKTDYDDLAYKTVSDFYETVKSTTRTINLSTSYTYLVEVAAHFQEALRLQRFYDLPNFDFAKKSNNIFCNYYFYLKKSGAITDDLPLDDFFSEMLGIDIPPYEKSTFVHTVATQLRNLYSMIDIDVISIPFYPEFQIFKRDYEIQLAYENKYRPRVVIDNDIQVILYLSDSTKHLDERLGIRSEPFLVTWDREFYTFRKTLMDKFQNIGPGFGYFYIYGPSKLSDRVSVSSFKLNPKSIDYNIISLTESNFNLVYKTSTYIDILSYFFEKRDLSELETAKKLLAIEGQTRNLDGQSTKEEIFEESSVIQDTLLNLRKHYTSEGDLFSFNDLIRVFENNEMTDKVVEILVNAPKGISQNESVFEEFNNLIKQLDSSK